MWFLFLVLFSSSSLYLLYLKLCGPFIVTKFPSWSLKYSVYDIGAQLIWNSFHDISYFIMVLLTRVFIFIMNSLQMTCIWMCTLRASAPANPASGGPPLLLLRVVSSLLQFRQYLFSESAVPLSEPQDCRFLSTSFSHPVTNNLSCLVSEEMSALFICPAPLPISTPALY